MTNPKPWYLSDTIRIAILQAILGVLGVAGTSYPTMGWIIIAKSILDILIRFKTDQPVTL